MILSSALLAGSILGGCGATNAGNGTNNPTENVTYRTNQASPTNPTNPTNQLNPNAPGDQITRTNPNRTNMDNYNNNNATLNRNNVTFDNQTAQKIADEVNKIKDVNYATTLINGNNVYVGVSTTGTNVNRQQLIQQVQNTVQRYAGNRNVQVVTDKNMVNRMSTLSARITGGNVPTNQLNTDIRSLFSDLGNTMQRPFNNVAR